MLKGWVRFVASKEPRNQYLYSVLIDLEGDSYERFTKCSVLVKQLCLHWQLCIPNKLRLLIQSLLLSNSLFTPIYWNFFTALLLADMIQPPLAIEWRFFICFILLLSLLKPYRTSIWFIVLNIIRINTYVYRFILRRTAWKFTT